MVRECGTSLPRGDHRGDGPEERRKVCSDVEGKRQQWPGNPKELGHNEGQLSLLEQSEQKTADAVSDKDQVSGTEEAGGSREMLSSLAHLDLNESPIKSFVSISEALVNFKKQFTVWLPGQSRQRKKEKF